MRNIGFGSAPLPPAPKPTSNIKTGLTALGVAASLALVAILVGKI